MGSSFQVTSNSLIKFIISRLWKNYQRVVRGIRNNQILETPLFRVTPRYAGTHYLPLNDVAQNLAEGIKKVFPGWRPALKTFELEVYVYFRFTDFYIMLSLTDVSQSLSQIKTHRNFGITPLRPSIAYSLNHIAKAKPGNSNHLIQFRNTQNQIEKLKFELKIFIFEPFKLFKNEFQHPVFCSK